MFNSIRHLLCFVLFIYFYFTSPAVNNSRFLVTVTADYINDNRLQTSLSGLQQIVKQSSRDMSELDLKRLDRVAHELANRNACHWLYQTLTKHYNTGTLVDVNRRISEPFQGNLMDKLNLNSKRLNLMDLSGYCSVPRNFTYAKGNLACKLKSIKGVKAFKAYKY